LCVPSVIDQRKFNKNTKKWDEIRNISTAGYYALGIRRRIHNKSVIKCKSKKFPKYKKEGRSILEVFKQITTYNRAKCVILNAASRRELQYPRGGTGNSMSDTYYMTHVEESKMALRW